MLKKRFVSIFLIQILIISIVGFASAASDPTDPNANLGEEVDNNIQKINENTENVNGIVDGLGDDLEKKNSYLDHIRQKINDKKYELRESAKLLLQKIIQKTSNKEDLTVDIANEAKLEKIELGGKSGEGSTLNVKVGGKDFTVSIGKLPEKVKGIEVTKNSIKYKVSETGHQYIELTKPGFTIIEKDGEIAIEGYVGADGEEHDVIISFEGKGRVTLKEEGVLEFSGGAKIYDPETKTWFELKDKSGAAGHVSFYDNGHIVKINAGSRILVTKEEQELTLEMIKSSDKGMFILSEDGINKDFGDYPSGFDKTNSFLIDPEGKLIYIPESKENVGMITGTGYNLIGIPNTPTGGVPLDGTQGYGGGNIFGNTTPPKEGTKPSGEGPPEEGGGILGSLLPWLLIGGGILLAVLLLSGGKDKDSGGHDRGGDGRNRKERGVPDDLGDNDRGKEPSTGKSATPESLEGRAPVVQTVYNKDR